MTWKFWAGFGALGFAVAALAQGYNMAAVIGGFIAAGIGAWWLGGELAASKMMLRRARAEIAAERAQALRQPRRTLPGPQAPVEPPWGPAAHPELDALYRPDGGPSFFVRHGHFPHEPCPPACPGNPFKPR